MNNKTNIIYSCVIFILMVLTVLFFASQKPIQESCGTNQYRQARLLMGTIVRLEICWDQADDEKVDLVYKKVWKRMGEIEKTMSKFDNQSDVWRINHSQQATISIDPQTYAIIQTSVEYARLTQGAFDITVGPLIELWKRSEETDTFPSKQQIEAATKKVGFADIDLKENNQIAIKNNQTKIDLGAVAKGYAADQAAQLLKEEGFDNFYMDAGGDVYVSGKNCLRKPWRIAIRDPQDQDAHVDVVLLSDQAITTSGDYERYFEIQSRRLSHLINPLSGYPQRKVTSSTVIAPSAQEADMLSTAIAIKGAKQGNQLIDSLGEGYASLVLQRTEEDGIKKYPSKRFKKYLAR